jgi:uncharacterized protein (DUF2252 family)
VHFGHPGAPVRSKCMQVNLLGRRSKEELHVRWLLQTYELASHARGATHGVTDLQRRGVIREARRGCRARASCAACCLAARTFHLRNRNIWSRFFFWLQKNIPRDQSTKCHVRKKHRSTGKSPSHIQVLYYYRFQVRYHGCILLKLRRQNYDDIV